MLEGKEMIDFTKCTSIGSLQNYISIENNNFVPMNANFCLFESLDDAIIEKYKEENKLRKVGKHDRHNLYAKRALNKIDEIISKGI